MLSLNQASAQAFERGLWRELRRELQKNRVKWMLFMGEKKKRLMPQMLRDQAFRRMVPVVGLEPTRCRHRRILNPLRLPIPSHRQICRNPLRRELWRELGKLLNEVYLESLEKSRGRQNDGLLDVLAFESCKPRFPALSSASFHSRKPLQFRGFRPFFVFLRKLQFVRKNTFGEN